MGLYLCVIWFPIENQMLLKTVEQLSYSKSSFKNMKERLSWWLSGKESMLPWHSLLASLLRLLLLVAKSCPTLSQPHGLVARQAPLSTGFPRQEYWSGWPFPPPEELSNLSIEPTSPALAGGFFTTEPLREVPLHTHLCPKLCLLWRHQSDCSKGPPCSGMTLP